jgi:PadR family transcriptional regulator PadR
MENISTDTEITELLSNWESVYKRGLLTFWILLLLHNNSTFPYEMNQKIEELSLGTMSADANSIYRALRRLEELRVVTSEMHRSNSGPDRRYYKLAEAGESLLAMFINRNLLVFQEQSVLDRIRTVLEDNGIEKEK